jgi:hypothetical protein
LIRVVQHVSEPLFEPKLEIGDRRAIVPLIGGGRATVNRDPPEAVFNLQRLLSEDEIAHPYLGPVAALHAHWLGRATFHGGALLLGERAFGLLGSRQAGKSSLLAEANRRGIPVLADDLLVVEGQNVFAGPRSLDLREPAARHFGMGRPLGVTGLRERWRVDLEEVPNRAPLAGWIFLNSSAATIRPVGAAERLAWLASNRSVKVNPADPSPLLGLAALPAIELSRADTWNELSELFDALVEAISRPETLG